MNGKLPRVAVVYRLDHPGGTQSVALALIRGLNRHGITPDILWDVPPSQGMLEKNGCHSGYYPIKFRVSTRLIDRMVTSLRYLAWIFNTYDGSRLAGRYDFFYVFHNCFLLPEMVHHLRYLNGPPLLPQLWTVPKGLRGWPVRFFSWLYHTVLYRWLPAYEYHTESPSVINSCYTAGLFEEAHAVRLPVVYPPIQIDGRTFRMDDLVQRDSLTFFSRIVDYKRPDLVLELAARNPAYRCVIMGGVPDHRISFFESLQVRAAALNIKNVEFLANPGNDRVRAELQRTRFYIFPAANEHFGMTTVEAIASGAIPFVHDSGGQREIVPVDDLRFGYTDYFEKFSDLASFPDSKLNQIRALLTTHIRQFSEQVSVDKLLAYIPELEATEAERVLL